VSKRCPCDEKPKKAKPPQVEIDGVTASPEFGAEDSSVYDGPGSPLSETDSRADVSAPDADSSTKLPHGHFIGPDGRLYRSVRVKQGSGYKDWSELAD
jgi:hypothetical protein